jgi:hypothetical protein
VTKVHILQIFWDVCLAWIPHQAPFQAYCCPPCYKQTLLYCFSINIYGCSPPPIHKHTIYLHVMGMICYHIQAGFSGWVIIHYWLYIFMPIFTPFDINLPWVQYIFLNNILQTYTMYYTCTLKHETLSDYLKVQHKSLTADELIIFCILNTTCTEAKEKLIIK